MTIQMGPVWQYFHLVMLVFQHLQNEIYNFCEILALATLGVKRG